MKIKFVTSNNNKAEEVAAILFEYGIEIEQVDFDYPEDKEKNIEEVARDGAKFCFKEFKEPLIVEDTGLFFSAYNNFPGALPKFVFNSIGFRGIMKLLDAEDRSAYFKSVIAYVNKKQEVYLFSDEMQGVIASRVVENKRDAVFMPYDQIFIPDGSDKLISEMSIEEKNKISQRSKATKKLGEFLKNS